MYGQRSNARPARTRGGIGKTSSASIYSQARPHTSEELFSPAILLVIARVNNSTTEARPSPKRNTLSIEMVPRVADHSKSASHSPQLSRENGASADAFMSRLIKERESFLDSSTLPPSPRTQ